jgi:hypothetical protein
MIRALTHDDPQITDTVCLLEWCREYQRRGPHPRPALERFCIGTYQISQALGWGIAGPVAWQSYCAACLHFMMAAEGMGLWPENGLPKSILNIDEAFPGHTAIIVHQGKAMQHVLYGMPNTGPHWKKRYRPSILRQAIASLVETCFQMVPKDYRAKGLSDEMGLLCGDVVIK